MTLKRPPYGADGGLRLGEALPSRFFWHTVEIIANSFPSVTQTLPTVLRWLAGPLSVLLLSAGAAAQPTIEKRAIQFNKGESGATVKGSIVGDRVIDYTLRAGAGQKMVVRLAASNPAAYFNVLPPRSETAIFIGSTAGNEFAAELPASGEYTIRVYLMRSAARRGESADYTLDVGIAGRSP